MFENRFCENIDPMKEEIHMNPAYEKLLKCYQSFQEKIDLHRKKQGLSRRTQPGAFEEEWSPVNTGLPIRVSLDMVQDLKSRMKERI